MKRTIFRKNPRITNNEQRITKISRPAVQLGLLLLVTVPALFWELEAADLSLMEARNFVTAREISEHGNWLLPTMNGQLRLAKPPLPTWLTLLSGLAAGNIENLAALRFPAACLAVILVLFTWLLARELSSDRLVPLLSALVLASSFAFVQAGRQGTWDIYCHSFMTGAIWLFTRASRRPKAAYGLFASCGILLAASFMSKGPVSFYALLLPFLLAWYTRKSRPPLSGNSQPLVLAAGLALVLALAWPAYVWMQVPHDLVATASRESTAWLERHNRPFWFYWSFPVETGAWVLLAAASLAIPYVRPRAGRYGNYPLLAAWTLLSVLLLSLIPEKKERYLLPALVPLSLTAGLYLRYLAGVFAGKVYTLVDYWLVRTTVLVLTLAASASPYLLYRFVYLPGNLSAAALGLASAWFLLGAAALVWGWRTGRFLVIVVTMALLQTGLFVAGIQPYSQRKHINQSYESLQGIRQIPQVKGLPLYAVGGMPMEYIWELGSPADTFRLDGPLALRRQQLPAALISPTPLPALLLARQGLLPQLLGSFRYRRDDPAALYYVYLLQAKP